MIRAEKACFWCVLLLLVIPVYCPAASQPADTIALWNGVKMPHGRQVTLYAFRPETPNGISVVVCPGGSYHWLDQETEGMKVGEWLRANGITAFVLLYRTAGKVEVAVTSPFLAVLSRLQAARMRQASALVTGEVAVPSPSRAP